MRVKKSNTVEIGDQLKTVSEWGEYGRSLLAGCRTVDDRDYRGIIEDDPAAALALATACISDNISFGIINTARAHRIMEGERGNGDSSASSQPSGAAARSPAVLAGSVTVYTSGTTGSPKPVSRSIESLNTFRNISPQDEQTWYCPYLTGTFAWYQMLSLALHVPGQHLVLPRNAFPVDSFSEALQRGRITSVSSTPTFWRAMLMQVPAESLASCKLVNITLGGETVDQDILDALIDQYPEAKIRHIYASTECGPAFVVADRQSGFPAHWLNDHERSPCIRLVDGELHVRSPHAATEYRDRWVATGDIVKVVGPRAFFIGRRENDFFNVGGFRVSAKEVQESILQSQLVEWAAVHPKKSPIVGNLVCARAVLKPSPSPKQSQADLQKFCRDHLADHAVPRFWDFLDEIPINPSLKS